MIPILVVTYGMLFGRNFIGKQALIDQLNVGIEKRLMGIEMDGVEMTPVAMPEAVMVDGQKVGTLTSAVYSPDYVGNIGFTMISAEHAHDGAKVIVESAQGFRNGVICEVGTLLKRVKANEALYS